MIINDFAIILLFTYCFCCDDVNQHALCVAGNLSLLIKAFITASAVNAEICCEMLRNE